MKKLFLLTILLLAGCVYSPPEAIRYAIDVQAKYTAVFVGRTMSLLEDDETRQIGAELVKNADALKRWANPGADKNEKADPERD
ncbi:MAG: hypothetical protein ACYS8W_00805 [Planctomycetota bacterium]|jgi:hypothetical protein